MSTVLFASLGWWWTVVELYLLLFSRLLVPFFVCSSDCQRILGSYAVLVRKELVSSVY